MMLPSMGKHTYHLQPRQRFQMVNWHLKGAMTVTDIMSILWHTKENVLLLAECLAK